MNALSKGASVILVLAATMAAGLTAARSQPLPSKATEVAQSVHQESIAHTLSASPQVSVNLAAFGSSVNSPRGPFRARPRRSRSISGATTALARTVFGSAISNGSTGAKPSLTQAASCTLAYGQATASSPPPGGIMLEQLLSCDNRNYYTSSSMLVPAGYPENPEWTGNGTSEQALTPCH
jgi:hypothetical protein